MIVNMFCEVGMTTGYPLLGAMIGAPGCLKLCTSTSFACWKSDPKAIAENRNKTPSIFMARSSSTSMRVSVAFEHSFPVLGFLNVYPFRFSYVADHFQYLASLGILVPIACTQIWKPCGNRLNGCRRPTVSYTHLTLPTNREV